MNPANSINVLKIRSLLHNHEVPKLMELASFKLSQSLISEFLFDRPQPEVEDELLDAFSKIHVYEEKYLDSLILPTGIKKIISSSLYKVRKTVYTWVSYNVGYVWDCGTPFYRSYFKCCVWQSINRIDYKETARKMYLEVSGLSKMRKFDLLSMYCLEDELGNYRPDPDLYENFDFQSVPLRFYWLCVLKNEFHKVLEEMDARYDSIEHLMLTQREVDNCWSVQYFFDRVSKHNRVNLVPIFLATEPTMKYQKIILSKLDEDELRYVISADPVQVMRNFCTYSIEPELVFEIWNQTKHLIDENGFFNLILHVLDEVNESCRAKDCTPILVQLWDTADDRLKKFFISAGEKVLMSYFFKKRSNIVDPDGLPFLFAVLSYSSPHYRRNLILNHGYDLIVRVRWDFTKIGDIIKISLPRAQEYNWFMGHVIESPVIKNYCGELFQKGNFNALDEFLVFYCTDEKARSSFKKQLLESNASKMNIAFENENEWSKFLELIDSAYTNPVSASKLKKKLFLSFVAKFNQKLPDSEQLDRFKEFVTRSLSDEESREVKQKLLAQFMKTIVNYPKVVMGQLAEWQFGIKYGYPAKLYDESYMKELVVWCSGGEDKVSEFTQKIPIDRIFRDVIEALVEISCELPQNIISTLQEFLIWRFVENEKVQEYKSREIYNIGDSAFLKSLITKRREVISWVFDGDEEKIRTFEEKLKA